MRILLDPLASLFGGSGSTSAATTTNQQVGAEGNSGPVFGAITIKGNKASNSKTNKTQQPSTASTGLSRGVTKTSGALQEPSTGGTASSSGAPLSSSAGNLNISVVSSDVNADNNLSVTSQGSIAAQNQLALASIAAQNDLAGRTLAVAAGIASDSFGFASQSQTFASDTQAQLAGNAGSVLQAGENFGAVGAGANPDYLAAPTGGTGTNGLLLIGVVLAALALLK